MNDAQFGEIDLALGDLVNKYIEDEDHFLWEDYKMKDKFYKIRNDLVELIDTMNNDQTEQLL